MIPLLARMLGAVAAGALLAASFPPVGWWWASPVAIALLVVVLSPLRGLPPRARTGALAGFLREYGVDALICGGIGGGARNALAQAGIQLYPGASGGADAQVEALLAGRLSYDPDTVCAHHDHGEGHDCGHHHDHDCGHGSCGSN